MGLGYSKGTRSQALAFLNSGAFTTNRLIRTAPLKRPSLLLTETMY